MSTLASRLLVTIRQLQRQLLGPMAQATSAGEGQAPRIKLTGRAFYESIGSPKMIVAPMVDRSEFVRASSPIPSRAMLTRSPGLETSYSIVPG
jgi:hypothetical protein